MSLITIDDSSEEMTIASGAADADADTKELDKETSDEKSSSDSDTDIENLNEESSNKSNDTDVLEPLQLEEGPCDSETTEATENNDERQEKPILELMKHLINYNGKQNTTLTNAELTKMLKIEFQIDVVNLPQISVEIYMNVLKKFLKDWPQWDEFDRVMHESRCMNDSEEIEKMLDREYKALRAYLADMLKSSRPWAREAARRVKRSAEILPPSPTAQAVTSDVILEVNCTRSQLKSLFFRKPHPDFNNTIFNVEDSIPSRISVSSPSLKAILNGCHVTLSINTDCFKYKRELIHDLKHTLLNKKNNHRTQSAKLNQHLQTPKVMLKKEQTVEKKDIKRITNKVLKTNKIKGLPDVETIFQIINEDVSVIKYDINVPSVYRHYMNPYSYVRYLHEDVNTESDKYDLQLEEKLSPRLKFLINKVCFEVSALNILSSWLKLECTYCDVPFFGLVGIEQLKGHFRDFHESEPDMTCTNCDKEFSVNKLAESRWYHKCVKPLIYSSDSE